MFLSWLSGSFCAFFYTGNSSGGGQQDPGETFFLCDCQDYRAPFDWVFSFCTVIGFRSPQMEMSFFWFWFCRERVWNRSGFHFKSCLYGYRSRHQRSFWLNWYNKGNVFRIRHSVCLCYFAKKRKERCNWHWSSYLNNKAFASLNRQD